MAGARLTVRAFLVFLVVLTIWSLPTQGCRSEVCRRRRSVTQEEVTLSLTGCSGRAKPWVRQVAYCLGKTTYLMAQKIKDWYKGTYLDCSMSCTQVRMGTRDRTEIGDCIDCFLFRLNNTDILTTEGVTESQLHHCIGQYVYAALSNELPTFDVLSNAAGRINLPAERPANDWWSLTVKLPCKPPFFQFLNAYCINSFADDVRARDFVLAQNKLTAGNITFIATFSDACRFEAKDIDIVWSESVASFAMPQLSSFSRTNRGDNTGNIYFDTEALAALEVADDGRIREFRESGSGSRRRRRKRREISEQTRNMVARQFSQLGLQMPCAVDSFKVTDGAGQTVSVTSNKKRHLIDTANFWKLENGIYKLTSDITRLNFTLNYGTNGCFFGPSEVTVVAKPEKDWLTSEKLVTCHVCNNAQSEEDCRDQGPPEGLRCHVGEICQSEVRQISSGKRAITKSCKQARACENNFLNNNRLQCRPGMPNSVCRCCCSDDLCNLDALHCT